MGDQSRATDRSAHVGKRRPVKGITAIEWSGDSERGTRCGIFGCDGAKAKLRKCRLCRHHYCPEHLKFHEETVPHFMRPRATS